MLRTSLLVLLVTMFSERITQFHSFVPLIKLFFCCDGFSTSPSFLISHPERSSNVTSSVEPFPSHRSYHSLLQEYFYYPFHSFNTHLNAYSDHIASKFDYVSIVPAGMQTSASKDHFLTTLALPELSTEVCTE